MTKNLSSEEIIEILRPDFIGAQNDRKMILLGQSFEKGKEGSKKVEDRPWLDI